MTEDRRSFCSARDGSPSFLRATNHGGGRPKNADTQPRAVIRSASPHQRAPGPRLGSGSNQAPQRLLRECKHHRQQGGAEQQGQRVHDRSAKQRRAPRLVAAIPGPKRQCQPGSAQFGDHAPWLWQQGSLVGVDPKSQCQGDENEAQTTLELPRAPASQSSLVSPWRYFIRGILPHLGEEPPKKL
jgi:hypothetical protein